MAKGEKGAEELGGCAGAYQLLDFITASTSLAKVAL